MKILTASEMQRIDRLTTERYGVPSLTLMENAGRGVVEFLVSRLAPLASHRIVILCGKGNNGGDGLVVARLLRDQGFHPRVLLFADPKGLRGDAAVNYERLLPSAPPEIIADREAWRAIAPSLIHTALFVDALLGTGLAKPLEGFWLEVVRHVNTEFPTARVLAVDLPSGISADSGDLIGEHMRADFSVAFTAPKIAHVFPPACECMGEWVVKQVGTPPEALESDASLLMNYAGRQDVAWIAKPRAAAANKGNFGHVLVLAGSVGKTGAAAMAARAALRAGAGLVTVATAKSALPIIAALGMEFMTEALPETDGAISLRALEGPSLDKLVAGKTVLAVGPGIGGHSETAEFVRTVVNKYSLPIVLDADGLNAFAGRMDSFRRDVPARRVDGVHATSRRNGATDGEDDSGNPKPARGRSARILQEIWRHPGAEGISNLGGLSAGTGLGESHGQSRNGHGRHRRCADGYDGWSPGTISCSSSERSGHGCGILTWSGGRPCNRRTGAAFHVGRGPFGKDPGRL